MNCEVKGFLFFDYAVESMIDTNSSKKFLVRTVFELTTNENYYETMYSQSVGSIDIAIKSICKNRTFSEVCEIAALCNVLQCNIRSVYPRIDFSPDYMTLWDSVFTPVPSVIASCSIAILWSHMDNENDVRAMNNGTWSPNHFVPLLLPNNIPAESEGYNNQSTLVHVVSHSARN